MGMKLWFGCFQNSKRRGGVDDNSPSPLQFFVVDKVEVRSSLKIGGGGVHNYPPDLFKALNFKFDLNYIKYVS